ncbi:MAG: hypothetical protein NTY65_06305 [Planctomycetota bacterium]|nr:hypothetical protein [Planctomycetota bacterium]
MAVRIYELAHEFDLATKEVLAAASEVGVDVKSTPARSKMTRPIRYGVTCR